MDSKSQLLAVSDREELIVASRFGAMNTVRRLVRTDDAKGCTPGGYCGLNAASGLQVESRY